MATPTVNHGTQEERDRLVLNIAWELDDIARRLPMLVPQDEGDGHFIVRSLAGRTADLVGVLYSLTQNRTDMPYDQRDYEALEYAVTLKFNTED
jgi:hypothetical protein